LIDLKNLHPQIIGDLSRQDYKNSGDCKNPEALKN